LAENTSSHTTITRSIDDRIITIQSNILNTTLLILLITFMIGVFLSFSTTLPKGIQPVHFIQCIIAALLASAVIFKNRMQYKLRYYILLVTLFMPAIFGMYRYGLVGNGVMFLIIATVFTSAFSSWKQSIIVLCFSALIIIVFMHLFCSGVIQLDFNQNQYPKQYISWMGILIVFIMFTGMLISVITGFFNHLKNLIIESANQLTHIEELNATLEAKVAKRTEDLLLSNKEKDRILGVVAHDLNNKLVGVIGYLDIMVDSAENISQSESQRFTNKALESSLSARDIVTDLLEFSKQKSDTLTTEHVDIVDFIQSTIDCHTPKALEKKIGLKIVPVSEPLYCNVNRAKFSRVIDNLITNALKFTNSEGSIIVNVEKVPTGGICISIKDSGIGIPDNLKELIFKPFSNAGRSGTAHEKSTGLGLSITKDIVNLHKGNIWFESEAGVGTTFFIWLP
jgi:signal transduction histidine kinase